MLVTCRTPWHQGHGLPGSSQENTEEPACYDALEVNDSAVRLLGGPPLKIVAHELPESVRRNVTIVRLPSPCHAFREREGLSGWWVRCKRPEERSWTNRTGDATASLSWSVRLDVDRSCPEKRWGPLILP
jgi:hypothetical protein